MNGWMDGQYGWMDRMDGRNGMGRRLMMSEAELCIPWLSLLTC